MTYILYNHSKVLGFLEVAGLIEITTRKEPGAGRQAL